MPEFGKYGYLGVSIPERVSAGLRPENFGRFKDSVEVSIPERVSAGLRQDQDRG